MKKNYTVVFASKNKKQAKELFKKLSVDQFISYSKISLKFSEDYNEYAVIETPNKYYSTVFAIGASIVLTENYKEIQFLNSGKSLLLPVINVEAEREK